MESIARKSDGRKIFPPEDTQRRIERVLRDEVTIAGLSRKVQVAQSLLARWKHLEGLILFTSRSIGLAVCTLVFAGVASAEPPDTTKTPSNANQPAVRHASVHEAQKDTAVVWLDAFVVTASRTRQLIREAPASMSVITSKEIETAPSQTYGDLLRSVPGVNVTQLSTRDVQVVPRGSAGTLANSQLVVVDGRQSNLDVFGFVMWDLIPVDASEVRQIEVMRTPGSAVWGANALSGVVNVITKSPREMVGTELVTGVGEVNTLYARVNHAGVNSKVGYKISASGYRQDGYARPPGNIPGTRTPYPSFSNQGTAQPKFDARIEYDQNEDATWSFSGGYAGTDGILHSGIGPFDIDRGTFLVFGEAKYENRTFRINAFADVLDGDATSLLTMDANGSPISFKFETQTFTLDLSNSTPLGDRNRLTYGAKARHSNYDITLARGATDRAEVGTFVQGEFEMGEPVRLVAGVRWDDLEPSGSALSPRASVLYTPHSDHTWRVSFNRAFRAPSVINNYIDITTINEITLPPDGDAFRFPSLVGGNPGLVSEHVTAIEAGYEATIMDRANVSVAVYRNQRKDGIDFFPASFYSSANPPPSWPLPPSAVPPNTLPESFSYRNHGEVIDRGFECGLQFYPHYAWSAFMNYSFQDDPEVRGIVRNEINTPPKHRFNVRVAYDWKSFFANANLNVVDKAFWVDVLDSRFWGPTQAFTQVNLAAGVRSLRRHLILTIKGSNLFNANVQQHVFGDIIGRRVVAEVRLRFD